MSLVRWISGALRAIPGNVRSGFPPGIASKQGDGAARRFRETARRSDKQGGLSPTRNGQTKKRGKPRRFNHLSEMTLRPAAARLPAW
ncbi:MAG: hypothetical protein E5X74_18220 [Mesorhizobium sp.]|nr:MAG: hypothetical protein E5X75_20785 [Mesorhizobium sp.]TIO83945.1 MAG: hypothetical protein E5X74_18220 [Mesorhizobium sp.]